MSGRASSAAALTARPARAFGRCCRVFTPVLSCPVLALCVVRRRALRCKSATASLGAMEQLGNLTVRFALQVCASRSERLHTARDKGERVTKHVMRGGARNHCCALLRVK